MMGLKQKVIVLGMVLFVNVLVFAFMGWLFAILSLFGSAPFAFAVLRQ